MPFRGGFDGQSGGVKKTLAILLFCRFCDGRKEYPETVNFLGFMSIICTILKKDMFSDKKYI